MDNPSQVGVWYNWEKMAKDYRNNFTQANIRETYDQPPQQQEERRPHLNDGEVTGGQDANQTNFS